MTTPEAKPQVKNIGILLYEDAEELDYVGPWEVFKMAAMQLEGLNVFTVAEREGPIRSANGLRVLPDYTFDDAPPLDVVLVPGGQGTRTEANNQVLLDWLAKASEPCTWVTSVCTGSMLLHAAGPAQGRRITTHWGFIDALREMAPDAEVVTDTRWIADGNVVTAAGVSAGIDMALWLTGQIWGVDLARSTQKLMEYDPAPPYSE